MDPKSRFFKLWLVKKKDHIVNFVKIIVMLITKQSQNEL